MKVHSLWPAGFFFFSPPRIPPSAVRLRCEEDHDRKTAIMAVVTTTTAATEAFELTADMPTAAGATATMCGPVRSTASNKSSGPSRTWAVADAVDAEPSDGRVVTPPASQSLWATTLLITTLCGVTFASSMTTGLLAVALPTMARELNISDGLMLW